MPGLYVPKSHRDNQQRKEAELIADWYAQTTPDFGDAMELQRRLQLRDVRLSVVWGSAGPHANRWVILRTAEDGQQHVVKVFRNEQGEYARPEPSAADRLQFIGGGVGDRMLREIEAAEQKQRDAAAKHNEELIAELGERFASDVLSAQGVKDNALITTAIPKGDAE